MAPAAIYFRLEITKNGERFSLIPKTSNSFAPINTEGMEIKGTRYYFKELDSFSCLVLKQEGKKEQVLGYQFAEVNKKNWEEKTGNYEHFGYQMLAGDMKFKSLELKITEDNVLMAVINPEDYNFSLPLDVLSPKYAKTAGVLSTYGMTLSFSENDQYHFVDFAGITFRKEK